MPAPCLPESTLAARVAAWRPRAEVIAPVITLGSRGGVVGGEGDRRGEMRGVCRLLSDAGRRDPCAEQESHQGMKADRRSSPPQRRGSRNR